MLTAISHGRNWGVCTKDFTFDSLFLFLKTSTSFFLYTPILIHYFCNVKISNGQIS